MPVPVRRVGRIARQDSEHSDSTHLLRDRHLLDSPSHITWIDPSSHRGVRLSNRTANRSVGDFKPWFKWTSSHTRPRKRDHFFSVLIWRVPHCGYPRTLGTRLPMRTGIQRLYRCGSNGLMLCPWTVDAMETKKRSISGAENASQ